MTDINLTHLQVSERVAALFQEYKQIQHTVRMLRVPLAEGNEYSARMLAIRSECWKYGVDLKKYL